MTTDPPCVNRAALFASPLLADHHQARRYCLHCPAAMFAACRKLASEQTNHDGTWAAVLYADGKVSRKGKRYAMDGGAM